MKRILLLTASLTVCIHAFTQEDMKTGIIYGDNHAYSLSAPDGWILDNKSGVSQGLFAVFYKKGESWKTAETVMYTNTASLEKPPHTNIDELIKYDLENFRQQYQGIKIQDGENIEFKNGKIARVKYLSGESYGNFEAIAYIEADKVGILVVMSSRSKKGFDNSKDAFQSLVKSYLFIANKVTIEEK